MPIEVGAEIRPCTREEFHSLDYEVMRLAFDVHNEMGRLHEEHIYQHELALRCSELGIPVRTEVPIRVSYRKFVKTLYIDLLLNSQVADELKAGDALVPAHRNQLLNYLFLSGAQYGKLVNFGGASVEHEFVTTNLTPEKRRIFKVVDKEYRCVGNRCAWFKDIIMELISEWGVFLDVGLYREAVQFLLGGEEASAQFVDVSCHGRRLGREHVQRLDQGSLFEITALTQDPDFYAKHLARFRRHTDITSIQWVNFCHHEVVFKTII